MVGALFKREDQSFAHSWLMMPHGASLFWRRRRSGRLILAAEAWPAFSFPSGKPPTYVYTYESYVSNSMHPNSSHFMPLELDTGEEAK